MSDRAAELDLMPDHAAIISLEAEFPGWMVFRQGRGVWLNTCFARQHETGTQVEGEDWADLRDELIRQVWKQESNEPQD